MDVVVIGGGVAGAVSALALRRLGAQVTVYEAHPQPGGDVGSYVSLAVNGLRALAELDCLAAVQARGFPVDRQRLWFGNGRPIADVPRSRRAGDDLRSITLLRAHLVDELRRAAVAAGARLVTGERLVDAAQAPGSGQGQPGGRVRARFASGHSVDADLLVGADGIWSTARGLLNPDLGAPRFAGQHTVSGVSTGVETDPSVFNLAFCRNGAFLWVAAPGGEVWWQAQVSSDEPPARTGVSKEHRLAQLIRLYRGEPTPLRIIEATSSLHPVIVNHFLGEVPVWHDERIVLVGDAAHPVGAGQGASMAIEDALALAVAVHDSAVHDSAVHDSAVHDNAGVPAALVRYEELRRPRIRKVLRTADDNRRVKKSGPLRRRLEQLMMPLVVPRVYERATGWLYAELPPRLPAAPARVSAAPTNAAPTNAAPTSTAPISTAPASAAPTGH